MAPPLHTTTALAAAFAALALAAPAAAQDAEPAPFRGSSMVYRNAMTAVSADPSSELTYNPVYTMSLSLAPRWYLAGETYVRAGTSVSRELTDSDWTTQQGEFILGDTTLGVGNSRLWVAPVIETAFSADLGVRLPTSKVSQARTLQVAIEPRVGISRTFPVLKGLSLGYGFAMAADLHEYTTGEIESPRIPGCVIDCERHVNTGVRNTRWRMSHTFSVGLGIFDWLSLGAGAGVHTHWLHPAMAVEGQSFEPQDDTSTRHYVNYDLEATVTPFSGFAVGLGATTYNPQQQPDSAYYDPVFNRFTELFIDLRFEAAGLASLGEG